MALRTSGPVCCSSYRQINSWLFQRADHTMHFNGPRPGLICPSCALSIPWKEISFDIPFRCPACDVNVCMPPWYNRAVAWGGMAIAGMIAYLLALEFDVGVLFTCVAFIPVGVVVSILLRRYCPIKLRLSDSPSMDLRGVRDRNSMSGPRRPSP